MKPFNVILCLVLVMMIAFGAFFYAGGTLRAQVSSISAKASEYPDAYASIQSVLATGTAPRIFTHDPLEDASYYSLLDVSITLTNRGIFDAEWLNIQVEGTNGDVAVYSLTGDGLDVSARSSAQVNLKLITRAPESAVRNVSIQYYVYGISRTIEVKV